MQKPNLRSLLKFANVPEGLIQELEAKPEAYQATFLDATLKIMENEVLNLLAFMEMKENLRQKANIEFKPKGE